ncbi:hypothetical protein [Saccharopolyspora taberi]|uniref:Uncharacterized protein n=1 Tax=Saccharopolyspora taberi TaxID=60895 RepID=A0ABN3VPS5_9PSEU
MSTPASSSDAMSFWAQKSIELDTLARDLENLLPPINADGEIPISDDTREEVEEAFARARLAADTILGAYTRRTFAERGAAQNHQNQPANGQYARW